MNRDYCGKSSRNWPPIRWPFPPYEQRQREASRETASTIEKGHGRIERRTLTTTARLNDYLNWPHVGQVFQLRRERTIDGETTVEIAYGVTSLTRSQASAEQLLALSRRHWGAIENGTHYVRDEAFGEDRSTIARGHAPQNLAALRNAGLNWLRTQKTDNITASLRSFARNSFRLLSKLGYPN
ncbi:MAG: ISAs1 family transposase [Planctomycetota bacterium]|nr:MAG: ISAs1 family transposase [Planctomycetota bacterium]REK30373.1 MAG: ISAs1 family transposase [Planctomycetota bacterium]